MLSLRSCIRKAKGEECNSLLSSSSSRVYYALYCTLYTHTYTPPPGQSSRENDGLNSSPTPLYTYQSCTHTSLLSFSNKPAKRKHVSSLLSSSSSSSRGPPLEEIGSGLFCLFYPDIAREGPSSSRQNLRDGQRVFEGAPQKIPASAF